MRRGSRLAFAAAESGKLSLAAALLALLAASARPRRRWKPAQGGRAEIG
jgi:hypothetical protein